MLRGVAWRDADVSGLSLDALGRQELGVGKGLGGLGEGLWTETGCVGRGRGSE